jgi:putative restriction endonuclease
MHGKEDVGLYRARHPSSVGWLHDDRPWSAIVKAFVAVTDNEWFEFLRRQPELTEINFWQPSGGRQFRALDPGQPLLFKLHAPKNFIVGGGFFATFSILPESLAWQTFGIQNGAPTQEVMHRRIEHYRKVEHDPHADYSIGCIVLEDPFFLDEPHWIPAPEDFFLNTVVGKTYDLTTLAGRSLWERVAGARAVEQHVGAESATMYGEPTLFRPRLGQGAFRIVVTDAYERRCAVTGEKTLLVLDAAHVRPVAQGGGHRIDNGLLLRSDVHTLLDRGYVTVTPDYRFRVSQRLRADWKNGKVYYDLDGQSIHLPSEPVARPNRTELEWHGDAVFLR